MFYIKLEFAANVDSKKLKQFSNVDSKKLKQCSYTISSQVFNKPYKYLKLNRHAIIALISKCRYQLF